MGERISSPQPPTAAMRDELAAAAGFFARAMGHRTEDPGDAGFARDAVALFSQELQRALEEKYAAHWHEAEPMRGSAFRCLKNDHGALDPLLVRAAERASALMVDRGKARREDPAAALAVAAAAPSSSADSATAPGARPPPKPRAMSNVSEDSGVGFADADGLGSPPGNSARFSMELADQHLLGLTIGGGPGAEEEDNALKDDETFGDGIVEWHPSAMLVHDDPLDLAAAAAAAAATGSRRSSKIMASVLQQQQQQQQQQRQGRSNSADSTSSGGGRHEEISDEGLASTDDDSLFSRSPESSASFVSASPAACSPPTTSAVKDGPASSADGFSYAAARPDRARDIEQSAAEWARAGMGWMSSGKTTKNGVLSRQASQSGFSALSTPAAPSLPSSSAATAAASTPADLQQQQAKAWLIARLKTLFPKHFVMWIDPGCVAYRAGTSGYVCPVFESPAYQTILAANAAFNASGSPQRSPVKSFVPSSFGVPNASAGVSGFFPSAASAQRVGSPSTRRPSYSQQAAAGAVSYMQPYPSDPLPPSAIANSSAASGAGPFHRSGSTSRLQASAAAFIPSQMINASGASGAPAASQSPAPGSMADSQSYMSRGPAGIAGGYSAGLRHGSFGSQGAAGSLGYNQQQQQQQQQQHQGQGYYASQYPVSSASSPAAWAEAQSGAWGQASFSSNPMNPMAKSGGAGFAGIGGGPASGGSFPVRVRNPLKIEDPRAIALQQ